MLLDLIIWYFWAGVLSWLILGGLFFMYPTVYRLKDQKDEFGWTVKLPLALWLLVGILADVVFNATWGTCIFRELPHEFLFTDRLKRHWLTLGGSEKQKARARPWVRRLNLIDPGHV